MVRIFSLLLLCAATAAPQTPEAAVLGGPCGPESENDVAAIHTWHSQVNAAGRHERAGDFAQAAEVAKEVVRGRCSNEHWWLKLAELHALSGREHEAVAALDAFYRRGSNAVDRRLRDPQSPLHALAETNVFQRSQLAASLAADRLAVEQRRDEARARLTALPRRMRPERWIAKGACPGECCSYGAWRALEDVILYTSPGGFSEAARVAAGRQVQALTGEVHLRPIPVRVRYGSLEHLTAEEGSIVFVLDYLGEGHGRILADGQQFDEHILSVHEHCAFPNRDCWGEVIDPDDAGRLRDGVWWVQISTPDGLIGWTRETGKFTTDY